MYSTTFQRVLSNVKGMFGEKTDEKLFLYLVKEKEKNLTLKIRVLLAFTKTADLSKSLLLLVSILKLEYCNSKT